jgi:hypothetical protein
MAAWVTLDFWSKLHHTICAVNGVPMVMDCQLTPWSVGTLLCQYAHFVDAHVRKASKEKRNIPMVINGIAVAAEAPTILFRSATVRPGK